MSEKGLREKELEAEYKKLVKESNLLKAKEKYYKDKLIEHNLLEELEEIEREYEKYDLESMTSMPKIATDIIEKNSKARDLKEKENIAKEKSVKDKLIEKNLKEAIMKSLENPGKVIPVDRSWAYEKPVLRPTNTNKAMRLTDEMNDECRTIKNRMDELRSKFYIEARFDQHFYNRWDKLKLFHGDELQSYKVKLENFYSDTDAKEKFKPKF